MEMKNLKPNEQRAKNAIVLIWVVLAVEMLVLISDYFQYELLQTAAKGGEITAEAAAANDARVTLFAVVYMIAYAVSAVTFIMWFRRAYANLHQMVGGLSQTEGWAAGSWFVPIVCLYRPYQIMKELYQETEKILERKGFAAKDDFTTNYLGWWWLLWILSNLIGQFVFRYSMSAESIDELIISTVVGMVGGVVGIPLAWITVKVIRDYSRLESVLYETKDEVETSTL